MSAVFLFHSEGGGLDLAAPQKNVADPGLRLGGVALPVGESVMISGWGESWQLEMPHDAKNISLIGLPRRFFRLLNALPTPVHLAAHGYCWREKNANFLGTPSNFCRIRIRWSR